MKCYRRSVFALAFLLIGYFSLALYGRTGFRDGEFFPIFPWNLFYRVPSNEREFVLVFEEIRGKRLAAKVTYQEAGKMVENPRSITVQVLVQKLGDALATKNAPLAMEHRRNLELTHLRNLVPVRYEIIEQRYDPLQRWANGKFNTRRSLGHFAFSG